MDEFVFEKVVYLTDTNAEGAPVFHRGSATYRAKIQPIRDSIAGIKRSHGAALRLRRYARIWLLSSDPGIEASRWARFQRASTSARFFQERSLVQSLRMYRSCLVTHLSHPGIPKTNNRVENLIKQLNRRLKTIEGFWTPQAALGYLRLWSIYHRFKPYTDCRRPHRRKNGKAPLECAGVDLTGLDWFRFSQKVQQ